MSQSSIDNVWYTIDEILVILFYIKKYDHVVIIKSFKKSSKKMKKKI